MGSSEVVGCVVDFFTKLDGTILNRMLSEESMAFFEDAIFEGEDLAYRLTEHFKNAVCQADRFELCVEKVLLFRFGFGNQNLIKMPVRFYLYHGNGICKCDLSVYILYTTKSILVIHIVKPGRLSNELLIKPSRKEKLFRKEEDIRYAEANRNYTLWHCIDGIHKERGSLISKIGCLSDSFIKVGISYCINVFYIDKIKSGEIYLITDERIRIPNGKIGDIERMIYKKRGLILADVSP